MYTRMLMPVSELVLTLMLTLSHAPTLMYTSLSLSNKNIDQDDVWMHRMRPYG